MLMNASFNKPILPIVWIIFIQQMFSEGGDLQKKKGNLIRTNKPVLVFFISI